jgi:polyferredoxin
LLAFFFALVLAAGGGHALLWNYITEDMSDDDAGNLMWANCPPWMRRAAWGVIGIGALLFFAQFALTIAGWLPKWGGPEEGFPPLMVGSFGLIWFTASGARTYSAMHQG